MASVLEYALRLKTSEFDRPLQQSESNLGGFNQAATGASSAMGGVASAAAGAAAAFAGFAAVTAAAKGVLESYAEFDGLVRGLKTVEGSAQATANRLTLLREVAKVPGLGFEEAVRGDIRLRAVGLSADLSERSMRAFGNAIATVGGGKADLDGVLLALTQIQAKGKVSAEEINQINERVPQVRAAMAAAFGTADTDALGKSTLTATQFIEGLVDELAKLPAVTSGARNQLDNYSDAWKELKNTASEFAVGIAGSWLDEVSGAFKTAAKDLRTLQSLLGIKTPGLEGPSSQSAESARIKAENDAKEQAIRDAEAAQRAADNRSADFWDQKAQERLEGEKARIAEKEAADKAAAERIRKAQEEIYGNRLTPEANLERQINNLRGQGPSGADAVNGAKSPQVAAQIAERTAQIVALEKQLADLRKSNADASQREAEAAAQKAAAAAKELADRNQARAAFAQEGAILEARAAGDTARVAQLEREAAIEQKKLQIMREQGLTETEARIEAEKRVALQARANGDAARTPLRERIAQERAARIRANRDERDGPGQLINAERAANALARRGPAADPAQAARENRRAEESKTPAAILAVVKELAENIDNLATA
jgi:tape measure domain-containing protein